MTSTPAVEEVMIQLSRIVTSVAFDASERNRRFLEFIVRETVEGRSERIKAYSIATEVFRRGKDFDPQLDSIVRIEAGRLRRSLEHYYLTAGAGDPVRIEIPKGSYAPVFSVAGKTESAGTPPPRRISPAHGPVILVRPFEEEGDQSAYPYFTRGFSRQLIVGLTRFTDLFVFGSDTSSRLGSDQHLIPDMGADFILAGSTIFEGNRLQVEVLLMDAGTGRYVWADQYDRPLDPQEILHMRDEIANKVIRSIAQPHGAIFRSRSRDMEGKLPSELSSQESVVRFYQYTQTLDRELFAPAFEALTATVSRERDYAEACACLARLYVDVNRFGFHPPQPVDNPLAKALDLALHAIELAPQSSRSHHALATAYWFGGDVDSSLAAYHAGLELNPNDAEITVDLGVRYAMLARWENAIPLLEVAYERNPFQPSTFRVAFSLYHLAHGRYAEALVEARRVIAPDVPYGHLLRAASAANLAYWDEARAATAELGKLRPDYGNTLVADLRSRNLHPALIRLLASGLSKVGVNVDLAQLAATESRVQVVSGADNPKPPVRSLRRLIP